MMNGATNHNGNILLMAQGRGDIPPVMALVNPTEPYNSTILLDNFFGRQFNSLNDVKVHPTSGAFFFCDVAYGWYQGFRPTPNIPNQVYRYVVRCSPKVPVNVSPVAIISFFSLTRFIRNYTPAKW